MSEQDCPLGRPRRLETTAGILIYSQRGEGPVLLFIQGLLANRRSWDRVVPVLATRYKCVTVEWPLGAHPEPMRADADLSPPGLAQLVIEVLDLLGLSGVTLVGNDSGGVLAQLVIAERPDLVEVAVLVACDAFECFPPGMYKYLFRASVLPGTVWLLAKLLRFPAVSHSRLGFGAVMRQPHDDRLLLSWTEPASTQRGIRRDLAKLMRGSSNRQTLRAAERFASFTKPVLVVWANHDRLFPAELGVRLATAFPDSHLETVQDSATFVSCDQPESLAELIDEYLSSRVRTDRPSA
jgi:pimeloyl-ACP methyl ester carboxylesterase